MTAAAGWYPDPRSGERLRYWDGTTWTTHVAVRPDAARPSSPVAAMPPLMPAGATAAAGSPAARDTPAVVTPYTASSAALKSQAASGPAKFNGRRPRLVAALVLGLLSVGAVAKGAVSDGGDRAATADSDSAVAVSFDVPADAVSPDECSSPVLQTSNEPARYVKGCSQPSRPFIDLLPVIAHEACSAFDWASEDLSLGPNTQGTGTSELVFSAHGISEHANFAPHGARVGAAGAQGFDAHRHLTGDNVGRITGMCYGAPSALSFDFSVAELQAAAGLLSVNVDVREGGPSPRPAATAADCADRAARRDDYSDVMRFWLDNGRPSEWDEDTNSIPCENEYSRADINSYFETYEFPVVVDLPTGLLCRDIADMDLPYSSAIAYWYAQGMPPAMDKDLNGVPCETVFADAR